MKNTALITGASSGIGLELAKIHASKGDNLVLVARSKQKLEELKAEFEKVNGVTVYVIGKDLSLPDSAKELYDETKSQGITIDYLINNAGFGDYGMFSDADWGKIDQMIKLNITALTHLTKLYLQDMKENGKGKIMNIASTASFQPGPLMAVYFATKAYVLSFSEAVNNELQGSGVTITALCPGPTQSGFQAAAQWEESSMVKDKKLPTSADVAMFGYNAMMKGKSVAVHGFKNKALILLVRLSPRSATVKLVRKFQKKA